MVRGRRRASDELPRGGGLSGSQISRRGQAGAGGPVQGSGLLETGYQTWTSATTGGAAIATVIRYSTLSGHSQPTYSERTAVTTSSIPSSDLAYTPHYRLGAIGHSSGRQAIRRAARRYDFQVPTPVDRRLRRLATLICSPLAKFLAARDLKIRSHMRMRCRSS